MYFKSAKISSPKIKHCFFKIVGSIEKGKDADLVVFDDDPLNTLPKLQE